MANAASVSATRKHGMLGAAYVSAAALGFSAKAIMVKLAYAYPIDAVTLLFLRMTISLPFFAAVALWAGRNAATGRLGRNDWLAIAALGLTGQFLASLLDLEGLRFISASLERVILFVYPTLVVILSALLFRRRIGLQIAAALFATYAGILLMFANSGAAAGGDALLGAALVFGSAVVFAVYFIGTAQIIGRIGSLRFTAYTMVVACLAAAIQFAATHQVRALQLPSQVYGLALAMALFSTVLPMFMLTEGIRRIGADKASVIGSVGPVATIFMAFAFLGEPIGVAQIVGTSLVIGGVLWISLKREPGSAVR
jgi:drug/metabolite transporter (DMT)-like permease